MLRYKGYTGDVELDEESGVLFGRVIGLRDVITFQGISVAEVVRAFHDSVDDYLEFCAKRGESPEKPYSGQFVLRIAPRLHGAMAREAQTRGTSLNALIEQTLEETFGPGLADGGNAVTVASVGREIAVQAKNYDPETGEPIAKDAGSARPRTRRPRRSG